MAEIRITKAARKEFSRLPRPIKWRMEKIFMRLRKWPEVSGAKPLSGNLAGHYRIRTGDYRVQFLLKGETVHIEKIGHRDGFYQE